MARARKREQMRELVRSLLLLITLTSGLVGIAVTSSASSNDPCYGIEVEIQTESLGPKNGDRSAKSLAAKIRKRHRLANVPPVTLVNNRLSDVPTVSFQRPTDFSCALAISKAAQSLANLSEGTSITPQAVDPSTRINVGIIKVWWPSDSATVIANISKPPL